MCNTVFNASTFSLGLVLLLVRVGSLSLGLKRIRLRSMISAVEFLY